MARRPRQDEERSMDSLMDAMTNVVGILLLILIVSSLGITAAVKEIMENMPEISQEQLEAMRTSRKKTLENLEDLRSTQADVKENSLKPEEAQQLALALEEFEKENADLASKTTDLEELLAKSKELEPIKEEKEERNTGAVKQLNDLEAALAAKPRMEPPPPRDITLPDPRAADPEAFVYYVACKHQKLYVIGEPYELMAKIRDVLDSNFAELAYRGSDPGWYTHTLYTTKRDDRDRSVPIMISYQARTKRAQEALSYMKKASIKTVANPSGKNMYQILFGMNETQQEQKKEWPVAKWRFDKQKVKAFFEVNAGRGDLVFHPVFVGDRIKIEVGLNPEKGISEENMLSSGSPFVNLIKKASVNRRVIVMYYVAPDSFETYLQARDYSTLKRIAAGWTLWDGERLTNIQPNKRRQSMPYNLAVLPEGEYLKISQEVGPQVAAKVNARIDSFDADLAKVPVPKNITAAPEIAEFKTGLKANREQWTKEIGYHVSNLYRSPLAVSEIDKTEDVLIQRHPPEIMLVRTFTPSNPPTRPRPKPAPPGTKPTKPKGPTGPTLILD